MATETTTEEEPPKITKKQQEKSVKIFLWILGILFLLAIIYVTTLTFTRQTDARFSYNGFDFKKDRVGYQLTLYINQAEYPALVKIRNKPQDLEEIQIEGDIQVLTKKEQIYITIDPDKNLTGKTTIAALEIDSFIDNVYFYEIPVNSAFTKEHKEGVVKTCADVSQTEGIISLDTGDETKIVVEEGCVKIEGQTEEDLIRAADRLVLTLLGVMEA